MLRTLKALGFVMLFSAAFIASAVSGEKENMWTKFNVGSWVLYEMGNTGMQQKQTLVEKTSNEITLKMETIKDGQSLFASDVKIPLQTAVSGTEATPQEKIAYDVKRMEEFIRVKNETLACQSYEVTTENGTGKNWVCDKVPGGIVRSEVNGNVILKLLEFEAK